MATALLLQIVRGRGRDRLNQAGSAPCVPTLTFSFVATCRVSPERKPSLVVPGTFERLAANGGTQAQMIQSTSSQHLQVLHQVNGREYLDNRPASPIKPAQTANLLASAGLSAHTLPRSEPMQPRSAMVASFSCPNRGKPADGQLNGPIYGLLAPAASVAVPQQPPISALGRRYGAFLALPGMPDLRAIGAVAAAAAGAEATYNRS